MHDIMMLLAILNDNYDVPLERNTRDAYDVTRQFQRGELPIAQKTAEDERKLLHAY